MAKKGYKHKTIAFRLDDPEDKRLYDELQSRAYGDFSRITKEMWEKRLKEGKKEIFSKTSNSIVDNMECRESVIALINISKFCRERESCSIYLEQIADQIEYFIYSLSKESDKS